jgi:hypothetical protein
VVGLLDFAWVLRKLGFASSLALRSVSSNNIHFSVCNVSS